MSDLLNSASLVMIPSGYKEDTVFSQIPTDGSGDLSFTRASNGTRINSAGLVEVVAWNLAQYSNTFNNGVWVTGGYGNLPTLTANSIANPVNGLTDAWTASFASAGTQGRLLQVFTGLPVGVPYTYSMYVKAGTKTSVSIYSDAASVGLNAVFNLSNGTITSLSGVTATITAMSNGWYYLTITNNILSSGNGQYGIITDTSDDGSLYIYGAQLNIGSTAKPYFPTTDRLNVPRLTYQNGGGGCPSLLLEKQSTNLVTYSEQFDNAGWTKYQGGTITANSVTSPDGTQNADTLTVASGQTYSGIYQSVSASSDVYTVSIFAKYNTKRWLFFFDASASAQGWFDIQNGVLGTIPSGHTGTIENFGNGWYRLTFKKNTAVIPSFFQIGLVDADGSSTPSSNGSSYIWGAQLEASSYPTSYIPTTSSSATRVADVMTVNLPNTNMTFCAYLELDEAPLGTSAGDWLQIYSNLSILGRAYGYNNVFGFADAYSLGVASGTKMLWKQESGTTAKIFKGGALVGTSTTGTYVDPFNRLRIDGAFLDKPLKIKEFVFFENNLTDAECIQLTS